MSSQDGGYYIRLQSQSHISATQWRQWAHVFGLNAEDVADVWYEIGDPIFIATRRLPPLSSILQLRAERLHIDILDFKEEIASLIAVLRFLERLNDDQLSRGKVVGHLFAFYHMHIYNGTDGVFPGPQIDQFVADVCKMILVVKVLNKENVALSDVLNIVVRGDSSVDKIVQIGAQHVKSRSFARAVRECWNSLSEPEVRNAPPEQDDGVEAVEEIEPMDRFMVDFRIALDAIYTARASEVQREGAAVALKVLDERADIIKHFDPINTPIPSFEEAEEIAAERDRAIDSQRVLRVHKPSTRSTGGATYSRARAQRGVPQDSYSSAADEPLDADEPSISVRSHNPLDSDDSDNSETTRPKVEDDAVEASDEPQDGEDAEPARTFQLDPTDITHVIGATSVAEFNEKAHQLGQLLKAVEHGDERVWRLFVDPSRQIEDCPGLAAELATADAPANQSFRLIRGTAQFIGLKSSLHIPAQPARNRSFNAVLTGIINLTTAGHKTLQPTERQLGPLEIVFDHACACLWRLETLRLNYLLGHHYPDQYTQQMVELQRLKSIGGIMHLADTQALEAPLAQAESDTRALLEAFGNAAFVKKVLDDACGYAEELRGSAQLASPQALEAAITDSPLEFLDIESDGCEVDSLPEDLLASEQFGPIFQRACTYICQRVWSVLRERHQPRQVIKKLQTSLRAVLFSCFTIQPEKRRHAARPRLSISVVSVGALSGHSALSAYYVRVGTDGKLLYVEGYEDGQYLDLLELRAFAQMRMQANHQLGDVEEGEPLQTGEKYLHTVGRTSQLFAASPEELLASCVHDDDGNTRIFPIFRPRGGR